jgi:hypothetical protein
MLALGALFGATAGAVIGAEWGDVGHWIVVGIPAGISVALAAGAVFSKPNRPRAMSGDSTILWTRSDDDSLPRPPRSLNRP